MIEPNQIIDDDEIKTPNKIRDDSFIKFCNEFDTEKVTTRTSDVLDDAGNKTGETESFDDIFDYVKVIRNNKGELVLW